MTIKNTIILLTKLNGLSSSICLQTMDFPRSLTLRFVIRKIIFNIYIAEFVIDLFNSRICNNFNLLKMAKNWVKKIMVRL